VSAAFPIQDLIDRNCPEVYLKPSLLPALKMAQSPRNPPQGHNISRLQFKVYDKMRQKQEWQRSSENKLPMARLMPRLFALSGE
jgi:hypothetical protein